MPSLNAAPPWNIERLGVNVKNCFTKSGRLFRMRLPNLLREPKSANPDLQVFPLVDDGTARAVDLETDDFESALQVQDDHRPVGCPGAGRDALVSQCADMLVLRKHQSCGQPLPPRSRSDAAQPAIETILVPIAELETDRARLVPCHQEHRLDHVWQSVFDVGGVETFKYLVGHLNQQFQICRLFLLQDFDLHRVGLALVLKQRVCEESGGKSNARILSKEPTRTPRTRKPTPRPPASQRRIPPAGASGACRA